MAFTVCVSHASSVFSPLSSEVALVLLFQPSCKLSMVARLADDCKLFLVVWKILSLSSKSGCSRNLDEELGQNATELAMVQAIGGVSQGFLSDLRTPEYLRDNAKQNCVLDANDFF